MREEIARILMAASDSSGDFEQAVNRSPSAGTQKGPVD